MQRCSTAVASSLTESVALAAIRPRGWACHMSATFELHLSMRLTFRLYTMSDVKAPRTLSVAHSCRLFMQR